MDSSLAQWTGELCWFKVALPLSNKSFRIVSAKTVDIIFAVVVNNFKSCEIGTTRKNFSVTVKKTLLGCSLTAVGCDTAIKMIGV